MKSKTMKEFPKKWTGVVEIKTGENAALLTTTEKDKQTDKQRVFPNGETKVRIALSDFPKEAKRIIKPNMKDPRTLRVRLGEDGDTVETVTPVNGLFQGKMTGIAKKQNGGYTFLVKTFNKGTEKENTHLEFIAQYEITDEKSPFRGVELPGYYLPYKFELSEDEDGMTQFDTADIPQAKQLHRLQSWAHVHGDILDEPIAWDSDATTPDNAVVEAYAAKHECEFADILETLEERALEADRPVNLLFKDGYLNDIQPFEDYGDFGDETSDEEIDEKFPNIEEVQDTVPSVATRSKLTKATEELKKASKVKKLAKKSESDEDDL